MECRRTDFLLRPPPIERSGDIALICAGTSDLYVAEECHATLRAMGHEPTRITDVGVAGLHRLLGRIDEIRTHKIIICIAGMEGALATVLAGLVSIPIIGVPTSIGYGCHMNGLTPLLGMLNSCAPGVVVCNIDNGYGAAIAALRFANLLPKTLEAHNGRTHSVHRSDRGTGWRYALCITTRCRSQ